MTEDPRLTLVYTEALRSITQQQGVLDQLRANAGTLLGAVSLATGFLGGLDGMNGLGPWGKVAIILFIVAVLGVMTILWPRTKWQFRMDAHTLISGYLDQDPPATIDDMHRSLAWYLERDYRANRDRLRLMFYIFEAATAVTAVEIVSWLIDLGRMK